MRGKSGCPQSTPIRAQHASRCELRWSFLGELFEIEQSKDSFYFKSPLCLPEYDTVSGFQNSPCILKKHMEVVFPSLSFDDQ